MALIPSLSAIPIIGKHIEKDKEKIVIYQPEEVKKYTAPSINNFDMRKCRLQLVYENNKVIAEGYLTELSINAPLDVGIMDVQVQGQLYNFLEL